MTIGSIVRAPRLSDEVARQLGAAIRGGDFLPGSRLPSEKELAERFDVSRMVVREAMSRLKAAFGAGESFNPCKAFPTSKGCGEVHSRVVRAFGEDGYV